MQPYYEHEGITIYHGDNREVMAQFPSCFRVDAVITDPPYGISLKFGGMGCKTSDAKNPMQGDKQEFNPEPFLKYEKVVLFGANHFAHKLPPAKGWLVWVKTLYPGSSVLSEAELAWTNCVPKVKVFQHLWSGAYRATEGKTFLHPTQKPVALMKWVLSLCARPGETVLDPYMGSGPIARACADMGRKYVGIEIEEKYCEIAAKRLAQGVLEIEA